MRITAAAREETRLRILDQARRLFAERGFEETSTRDLAGAAGIAAGTLFNYFATKEDVALAIASAALDSARASLRTDGKASSGLAEDLFALVLEELRALEPQRGYLADVLLAAMSPFRRASEGGGAEAWRTEHLELVAAAMRRHGYEGDEGLFASHLYWTLYLGVLAYWCADASPDQEETLAVLDRSTRLFADSLHRD